MGTAMLNKKIFKILIAAGIAAVAGGAIAAGQVSQLSGTLSVRKADGSVRILSQKSDIADGDTLNTQRDSYAQIKFPDGGQITMKPNSTVKIEKFNFEQSQPQSDSFLFGLV